MLPNPMFRYVALEKLSSPERLDALTRITDPRGWIALLALAALVVALVAWSVLGTVPLWVTGRGMLLTPAGVMDVVALEGGVLLAQLVQPGDTIAEGQVVARVRTASGEVRDLPSLIGGRALELHAYRGDFVQVGQSLITLQPTDEELMAFLYVPAATGQQITPGMTVQLAPSTVRPEEFGFLLGTVQRVTEFPSTALGITALTNSPELAASFLAAGPVYEVRIDLQRDRRTESGYAWSSTEGPPLQLAAGTFVNGSVVVASRRPISFLLPAAR